MDFLKLKKKNCFSSASSHILRTPFPLFYEVFPTQTEQSSEVKLTSSRRNSFQRKIHLIFNDSVHSYFSLELECSCDYIEYITLDLILPQEFLSIQKCETIHLIVLSTEMLRKFITRTTFREKIKEIGCKKEFSIEMFLKL